MFSVYGVQGRIFSGPVDQWRRVAQVSALHRSAALRPGSPQGRGVDSGHEAATAAAATLSAYTDTQQGGGQRHPLSQVHELMSQVVRLVMLETGLPGLPVADAQGQVVGFISRSDILLAVVAEPPLELWA